MAFLAVDTASVVSVLDFIPQADWDGGRVFIPVSHRIEVKRAREFERVASLRHLRLFPEDLAGRAGELLITFRASMAAELDRADCLAGARAMWHCYPTRPPARGCASGSPELDQVQARLREAKQTKPPDQARAPDRAPA